MANPGATLAPPRLQQVDKDNPFQHDLFARKELAEQLTGYLDRLRDGAVRLNSRPRKRLGYQTSNQVFFKSGVALHI